MLVTISNFLFTAYVLATGTYPHRWAPNWAKKILQLTVVSNFIPNDCDRTMQGLAVCTLDPLHDTITVYVYVLQPVHKHAYTVCDVKKIHEMNQYNLKIQSIN